jgi:large subunit ribosomal protein L6
MRIAVPAGVTVELKPGTVTVKGPKGTLCRDIADRNIEVKADGGFISVERKSESKDTKSKHGLYRQLINNMVTGVVTPFTKSLIIMGVGYKAAMNGDKLVMNIGYSHPVNYTAPEGITLACPDPTTVTVSGIDKELVGQTAATIKSKRPVEPYHNYGLHYSDEVLVKKEGKTAGK